MWVVWKPPAMLITLSSFAGIVLFSLIVRQLVSIGEGTAFVRGCFILMGIAIVFADLRWRRGRGLSPFDLNHSTFFWILPTWGLGSLIIGMAFVYRISAAAPP